MHQHLAHPPGPEPTPGIIDNISDTLLNAFARVRKPDDRFVQMRESVDKFEDGLVLSERLWNRIRGRTNGKSAGFAFFMGNSEAKREANWNPVKTLRLTITISLSPFRVSDFWNQESQIRSITSRTPSLSFPRCFVTRYRSSRLSSVLL